MTANTLFNHMPGRELSCWGDYKADRPHISYHFIIIYYWIDCYQAVLLKKNLHDLVLFSPCGAYLALRWMCSAGQRTRWLLHLLQKMRGEWGGTTK